MKNFQKVKWLLALTHPTAFRSQLCLYLAWTQNQPFPLCFIDLLSVRFSFSKTRKSYTLEAFLLFLGWQIIVKGVKRFDIWNYAFNFIWTLYSIFKHFLSLLSTFLSNSNIYFLTISNYLQFLNPPTLFYFIEYNFSFVYALFNV